VTQRDGSSVLFQVFHPVAQKNRPFVFFGVE